jgi:hypothetical protein
MNIDPRYRCYVYFNIGNGPHRGTWSVSQRNKVVAHVRDIVLRDARFLVAPAGRERVRREGRKNVHAGVSGFFVSLDSEPYRIYNWEPVTYNPYKYDSFVLCRDQSPILAADYADLSVDCPNKVIAIWEKKDV